MYDKLTYASAQQPLAMHFELMVRCQVDNCNEAEHIEIFGNTFKQLCLTIQEAVNGTEKTPHDLLMTSYNTNTKGYWVTLNDGRLGNIIFYNIISQQYPLSPISARESARVNKAVRCLKMHQHWFQQDLQKKHRDIVINPHWFSLQSSESMISGK